MKSFLHLSPREHRDYAEKEWLWRDRYDMLPRDDQTDVRWINRVIVVVCVLALVAIVTGVLM